MPDKEMYYFMVSSFITLSQYYSQKQVMVHDYFLLTKIFYNFKQGDFISHGGDMGILTMLWET